MINQTAKISPDTVERVQSPIRSLGYHNSPRAELHKGGRTIAVFIPDLSNEFYSNVAQVISAQAAKNNYGMIFCGGGIEDESQILNAAKMVPVVLCDRQIVGSRIPSIRTNNQNAMRQIVSRLYHAGYTQIGYISEKPVMSNIHEHCQGARMGPEENGLAIHEDWMILDPNLRTEKCKNSYNLMISMLATYRKSPQVLLCGSNLIAVGVPAALRDKGFRVPNDVGVVGFDNISIARYMTPPLTTIAQDKKQLGKMSVRTLIQKIEHEEPVEEETILGAKIIIRDSVLL